MWPLCSWAPTAAAVLRSLCDVEAIVVCMAECSLEAKATDIAVALRALLPAPPAARWRRRRALLSLDRDGVHLVGYVDASLALAAALALDVDVPFACELHEAAARCVAAAFGDPASRLWLCCGSCVGARAAALPHHATAFRGAFYAVHYVTLLALLCDTSDAAMHHCYSAVAELCFASVGSGGAPVALLTCLAHARLRLLSSVCAALAAFFEAVELLPSVP